MNIFLEETTKPLTRKRHIGIWLMLFTLTPLVFYVYGKQQAATKAHNELVRLHSMPVNVALPSQLPVNTWEF